ncbi:MAG: hypothetical protein AB7W47_07765 [Calditrichaceae bacterium]
MKKINAVDRIVLLLTGLLAAYQVVEGMHGYEFWTTFYYTTAFGVLLIAGLLIILFGFDILDSPMVVVVATILPLTLSLGLISNYLPEYHSGYSIFAIAGFILVAVTRYTTGGKSATISLAIVHGIAGMIIFLLPIIFSIRGNTNPVFAFVGLGGALIGLGGLLLAFLKAGKPILSRDLIFMILPLLLLLMTASFVIGFSGAV